MLEINKKEFREKFRMGDIIGLENLNKQLQILKIEIHRNMNMNIDDCTKMIINTGIADILCEMETRVNKALDLLHFVNDLNCIFVDIQDIRDFDKYYDLADELYHMALNDLLDMLDINMESEV
mgnify:CR=1 FL=1